MDQTAHSKCLPWWTWIVAADAILLGITALGSLHLDLPYLWRLQHTFALTHEMNAGAWWSGLCLFAVALLAWELGATRQRATTGPAWIGLACTVALLSFDEIGSLHERLRLIDSWERFLLGAIAVACVPLYVVVALFRHRETRRASVLIAGAFALFATVAAQEWIEVSFDWAQLPPLARAARSVLEEGTELAAALLLLSAVVGQRRRPGGSLDMLIADVRRMPSLAVVLVAGLAVHLALCLVVVPGLTDVPLRGNPAVWYPAMLNFVLCCAAWTRVAGGRPSARLARGAVAAGFAVVSAVLMTDFTKLVPGADEGPLAGLWGRLWLVYAWQAALIAWVTVTWRGRADPVLGVAGVALGVLAATGHLGGAGRPGPMLAGYGAFACVVGLAVLTPAARAGRVSAGPPPVRVPGRLGPSGRAPA